MLLRLLATALLLICTTALAAPWQGGGPDIGWVTSLLRPFGPDGPLYAGTYGGGIWRSEDDGVTWSEVTTNARDAVVWDLARGDDPLTTFYAATEDRGLLRSESFSSQWRPANTGLGTGLVPAVFDVEVFPLDPLRIVAGTSSGAQVSRSRGDAWADTLRVSPVEPVRAVTVLPQTPRTVHYVGPSGLGIQRGSEAVLETIDAGLPGDAFLFDLAPWPGDVDRFVVADFDGEVWDVVDGARFEPTKAGAGFSPRPRFYRVDVTDGGSGPVIRVGADRGLFVSADGGATWTQQARGRSAVHAEIWEILVDDPSTGELLLGGFVDGVLRASPAITGWQPRTTGLRAAWVRAVDARDGVVLAGTAHGRLYRSDDAALTWTEVTGALDDLQLTTVWIGDGTPWVVTAAGGVYVTDDGGTSWDRAVLPAGATRLNVIVAGGPGRLLAASDDGLLESPDEGRTWKHVEGLDERRSAFALSHRAGRTAVAFDPVPSADARVLVDVGAGFEDLGLDRDARVRGLAFVGGDANTLLVARRPQSAGNLIFVENLVGPQQRTVREATAGPVGQVVEPVDLERVPASRRLVLATSSHGVLFSDDDGETWREANEGLAGLRTEDLAIDVSGATVRVALGTFARGAWARPLDDLVSIAPEGDGDPTPVPAVTRLLPAAPNPFNPRTSIRWEQAAADDAVLEIFDLRGRLLRALLHRRLEPGSHRVTWDGTDDQGRTVASGTYLARLRVGQRVHTTRLTLVR